MKKKMIFLGTFFFMAFLIFSDEQERLLSFSGYEWVVKDYARRIGPGPNRFSAEALSLRDDSLELAIIPSKRHWICSEVYSRDYFSYGTYTLVFDIHRSLDLQAVFGFFLYNDQLSPHYNEIDFEAARWGIDGAKPFQFSVQPYEKLGNSLPFRGIDEGAFVCRITWTEEKILFLLSERGGRILKEWEYRGWDIPVDTESRVHLNLWLFEGGPPEGDGGLDVVVHSFSYEKN